MPLGAQVLESKQSRLFFQEGGSGPGVPARYKGLMISGALNKGFGDITPVRIPSRTSYAQFTTIGSIQGQEDLPTLAITSMHRRTLNGLYTVGVRKCPVTIHIHTGACQDPTDFLNGFDMAWVLSEAQLTSWAPSGDLGAMDGDANEVVMDNVDLTGVDLYQIVKMTGSQFAASDITDPVVAVLVPSAQSCAECGLDNDGTRVLIAVMAGTTGSPGLPTEYVYTKDGGSTFGTGQINSMAMAEVAVDAAIVGSYIVVISGGSDDNLHYALLSDVLSGAPNPWSATGSGIVDAGSPTRIYGLDAGNAWIVGDGGYVYKLRSATGGVVVQTDGSVTVQNLADVQAFDESNVLAVGASNAVLYTTNGGKAWVAVTGPSVGDGLTACWMLSPSTWFVGNDDGELWYTKDRGATWTQIATTGFGAGNIEAIRFATKEVGYISHTLAGRGRILRTIDGGDSWYALPEAGGGTLPLADAFTRLGVPRDLPGQLGANLVWGGGINDNGTDGILVKVVGADPE